MKENWFWGAIRDLCKDWDHKKPKIALRLKKILGLIISCQMRGKVQWQENYVLRGAVPQVEI